MKQITFIITSVIFFENRELCYTSTRSAFTPEIRAVQTLKTIESIYQAIPEAKIVLVELGKKRRLPFDLETKVEQYLFLGANPLVRYACDSRYKGLGEAVGMIFALLKLKKSDDLYFKISGRYFLNSDFDINNWCNSGFSFRKYEDALSTRMFSFSKGYIFLLGKAYLKSLNALRLGISIENILFQHISKAKISLVDKIGISGYVAPDGSFLTE